MKLLFDHNLSPLLISWLEDIFPGSEHVFDVGLDTTGDIEIREYAKVHDLIIVTKDSDFNDLSLLKGFPPKVIWLRIGNCKSRTIETLLRNHVDAISEFANDSDYGVLTLS